MNNRIFYTVFLAALPGYFGCGDSEPPTKIATDTAKVGTFNLQNILFTTPTIENALPEFTEKTDTCAFFHEDEWRQIEFVSKDQKASVDKEISKIRNVLDNQSHKGESYVGYRDIAVRNLITRPLSIDLALLVSYLTKKKVKIQGLGLEGNPGQVKGGFFFNIDGVNYYGVSENNNVSTFGIYSADSDQHLRAATDNIAKLLEAQKLYLVDWRRINVFDEANIRSGLVK